MLRIKTKTDIFIQESDFLLDVPDNGIGCLDPAVELALLGACLLYTSLEDLESRVSEHSSATESLKKTLDAQTARMKAIKQVYDSSAAFQSL